MSGSSKKREMKCLSGRVLYVRLALTFVFRPFPILGGMDSPRLIKYVTGMHKKG